MKDAWTFGQNTGIEKKAYISFYSKLIDEFRKKYGIEIKDVSPDGASWIVVQTVPRGKSPSGVALHLRSAVAIDYESNYVPIIHNQGQTKAVFDKINMQGESLERQMETPEIRWERLGS